MVPSLPPPPPPLPLLPLPPIAPPPPSPTLLTIFNTPPILSMNIKHSIETKFELPNFNWTPLKPQEIQGTLFSELDDDENLSKIIDFEKFEESFQIYKIISNINSDNRKKKIENVSLLEKEHQRNIGKSIMKPFLMNKLNSLPKMAKILLNILKT
jgi:formic-like protein